VNDITPSRSRFTKQAGPAGQGVHPLEIRTATTLSPLDIDRILCECKVEPLRELVVELEGAYPIAVIRSPSVCLTMIPAEDSLEKQKFFLGEALTTECEVLADQQPGYGLCLGDEPVRSYCMAVIDAFVHGDSPLPGRIEAFLREQEALLARQQQEESDLILQTQVDFKLMEEE
jgi:phosphonate C-P lyase system protein PhnG